MQNMILVLHLLLCVVLVGAVLMQRSEGGALGMGGGGTGGLISGRGAADMMVNITGWVGGAFFVTSIFLAFLASSGPTDRSVIPENGAAKSGFHFTIPGLPKAPATKASDFTVPASSTPVTAAPVAPPPGDGPAAPAPVEAVTRAGPLSAQPVAVVPVGAVRTPPPAASLPASQPVGAPRATTGPVGAAQKKTTQPASTPAAAQKTTTTAPMIPLPAATPPAPAAESAQVPVPAPPERQKAGPDE